MHNLEEDGVGDEVRQKGSAKNNWRMVVKRLKNVKIRRRLKRPNKIFYWARNALQTIIIRPSSSGITINSIVNEPRSGQHKELSVADLVIGPGPGLLNVLICGVGAPREISHAPPPPRKRT